MTFLTESTIASLKSWELKGTPDATPDKKNKALLNLLRDMGAY